MGYEIMERRLLLPLRGGGSIEEVVRAVPLGTPQGKAPSIRGSVPSRGPRDGRGRLSIFRQPAAAQNPLRAAAR